jgi:primosomal protein N' (replication factor Y)
VALLLNRRGVANLVCCQSCGFSNQCPNCDINLTLHAGHHLVCHYCDYHENFKLQCPSCHTGQLTALGLGTEKVEEDLKKLFPSKQMARADRDEIQNRLEMENLIADMESGKTDILIGTQMIAKGLDFPKLNLVGLVLADVGFNLPDFRSTEKSFQLITQMSGRAGRHITSEDKYGEVVVQTYNTDHESLKFAKNHDYFGFVENELLNRSPLKYPPFQKIVSFRIQSMDQNQVQKAVHLLKLRAEKLKEKFSANYAEIEILGPSAAPIAKLRNQFRFHMLLKGPNSKQMNQFARQLLSDQKWIPTKVKVLVDVDPINLL